MQQNQPTMSSDHKHKILNQCFRTVPINQIERWPYFFKKENVYISIGNRNMSQSFILNNNLKWYEE